MYLFRIKEKAFYVQKSILFKYLSIHVPFRETISKFCQNKINSEKQNFIMTPKNYYHSTSLGFHNLTKTDVFDTHLTYYIKYNDLVVPVALI